MQRQGMKMDERSISVPEIGDALWGALHLGLKPLCMFESETVPENGQPFGQVDRCLAKSIFLCARGEEISLYLGADAKAGVCPGGQVWTGLMEMTDGLNYFISTGSPSYRHGEAEFLKRDPQMVKDSVEVVGKIRASSKYLCVTPCHDFLDDMGTPRSILVFAGAEQVRNLLGLLHFGTKDVFSSAIAPWGPSCASFITYPVGMAANCPRGSVIIGPTDPTGNEWLPPSIMSLGIPIKEAERLVRDIPGSFLVKRPGVAFPKGR